MSFYSAYSIFTMMGTLVPVMMAGGIIFSIIKLIVDNANTKRQLALEQERIFNDAQMSAAQLLLTRISEDGYELPELPKFDKKTNTYKSKY